MIYDVIVIGGGITGAGVARDAAMRGLKTLLLEKGAPGNETTGASSHLIHGGLRYLLYDRITTHTTCWDSGHIVRIAQPLLRRLPFLWPVYSWHKRGIETVETLLEVYDGFQNMKGGKKHLRLSAEDTVTLVPGIKTDGLLGSLAFDEWWVDPIGLVEKNLASARKHGADIRTQAPVESLIKSGRGVSGVRVGGRDYKAKMVINAAGPWVNKISSMADIEIPLRLQKGTHLVYERELSKVGLLVEAAGKNRYVFMIPSGGKTLIGPTDISIKGGPEKVKTSEEEIKYLLDSMRLYLPDFPLEYDRTTVGARPILGQKGSEKLLSREFEVFDHSRRDGVDGFLTIGGGKMSDFRIMAESVVTLACKRIGVDAACRTQHETLDGNPIGDFPSYPRPWRPLKKFLRHYPRLRELYSMSFLGAAFARHIARRVFQGRGVTSAAKFPEHFAR